VLAALVACAAVPASAAAALPDLVSDPAERPRLAVDATGGRLLLRFDSFVHNVGPGPLEVLGTAPASGAMGSVEQVVDGTPQAMPGASMVFEHALVSNEDGHDHWHLQAAARYSLHHLEGAGAPLAAAKVGFCLVDSLRVDPDGGDASFTGCGSALSSSVRMGVSAGWRDLYASTPAFQWVDVSATPPGTYLLRSEIDPDGVVDEVDERNPGADVTVRIPGYTGRARSATRTVELAADPVHPASGTLRPPRYRIETAPRHGTIDRAVGEWFSDPWSATPQRTRAHRSPTSWSTRRARATATSPPRRRARRSFSEAATPSRSRARRRS
jgi:hypothetical protein